MPWDAPGTRLCIPRISTGLPRAAPASPTPIHRHRCAFRHVRRWPAATMSTAPGSGTAPPPMTGLPPHGCTGCAMPGTRWCRSASCISAAARMTTGSARRFCRCMSSAASAGWRPCSAKIRRPMTRRRNLPPTAAPEAAATLTMTLPSPPPPPTGSPHGEMPNGLGRPLCHLSARIFR